MVTVSTPTPLEQPTRDEIAPMPQARLGHVALVSRDPVAQAAFYREFFGMQLVGDSANGATTFLASFPEEESHDLAFVREQATAHIALKVETLEDLLAAYRGLQARDVKIAATFNHGVALAIYFPDPDGNLIELYWPTGKSGFWLPVIRPIDLGQPVALLRRIVEEFEPTRRAATN
jgi:catechol-2,3-dioxygenase